MDISILNWIDNNLHGNVIFNYLFKYITYTGEWGAIWLLTAIVLLCFRRTRRGAIILLLGYCGVAFVNNIILKHIINRARPFVENPNFITFADSINLKLPDSSSFPSGHTALSFMASTILTLSFGKNGAWSYIWAVLVGFSRLFLCVHYPTDVLGGLIIGLVVAFAVFYVCKWLFPKIENWWHSRIKDKPSSEKENS